MSIFECFPAAPLLLRQLQQVLGVGAQEGAQMHGIHIGSEADAMARSTRHYLHMTREGKSEVKLLRD
jgi:hypothetical protein